MNRRKLVVGVDSSTQSVKVVVRDAQTGELIRQARSAHSNGTEVNPEIWRKALTEALLEADALEGIAAVSIAGQQHGGFAHCAELDDHSPVRVDG